MISNNISKSLSHFIGSGMMDYAYMESRHFSTDLSLGVNPLGCSPKVIDYYQEKDIQFSKYSEVVSSTLREKVAQKYGFQNDEVLLGAGVSELLHLCYLTFMDPGDSVLIPETTFPPLEFLAILTHGQAVYLPQDKSFDIDYAAVSTQLDPKIKMVILCNPNNPTGIQIKYDFVKSLASSNSKVAFVIDEANIDFGGQSLIDLVHELDNLVVLRSFSKGFGLAGLRIGFAIGQKDLIYALQRRQTPFSVNVFAQKLAMVALDDMKYLEKTAQYTQSGRKYLEQEFSTLGYTFCRSDSNYLLLDVTSKFKSSNSFIEFLNTHDANAVDGNDFRGLGGKYVRLSPRNQETNEKFIEIMKHSASTY